MLTLDEAVQALGGDPIGIDQPLTETVIDSRLASPGSLFVALPGETTDGHEYVGDAFQRGAAAALIEREVQGDILTIDLRGGARPDSAAPPLCLLVEDSLAGLQSIAAYWRRQIEVRVIGITGSVGKTTTKELTAEMLSGRFETLKNPGNLNNEIGLPLTLLKLRDSHERAVLEMGFYVPGEIALLCELAQPQVGVVTNIGPVHMARAGSLEAIVAGKAELVESLPPAPDGVAVLNYDDPHVRGMAEKTEAEIFFYGLSPEADLWASDIEGLGLDGVRFVLHHEGESFHVRLPLLGRHSVHTALRAASVGLIEGLTLDWIIGGLQDSRTQLRLFTVRGPQGAVLLDDTYNSAPASANAALNLLQDLDGRRIAVLGDMLELGDYEERGHRMVGARAAEVVDELVVVGERARWIAQEARRAGLPDESISELEDSQAAIEHLRGRIGEGDVLLVKGSRGMKMDRIVSELEERP